MKFSYELDELVDLLVPKKVVGHTSFPISHIESLTKTKQGGISFLGNPKYKKDVATSQASVIALKSLVRSLSQEKPGLRALGLGAPNVSPIGNSGEEDLRDQKNVVYCYIPE
jgi:UDP-3-O-[3-hydroxymyristoyl] glucosamine N-acyltransferase